MSAPNDPRYTAHPDDSYRYTPGVGPHHVTADTPRRPASSFHGIANPLGYEEKRLGVGGGIGSERHTQDLMGGLSVVVILAMALVSSLAFPPLFFVWVVIGIWVAVLEIAAPYGRRVLAAEQHARDVAAGLVPPDEVVSVRPWTPGPGPQGGR